MRRCAPAELVRRVRRAGPGGARERGGARAGVQPPKPPKNQKLGDSNCGSQRPKPGHLQNSEESEDSSGPAASAELSMQELGLTGSRLPDENTCAASGVLRQLEEELRPPLPPSQKSAERFVPQFAKLRKTVTKRAERREEDLQSESGAVSLGSLPEPSAPRAGSQLLEESEGLAAVETRELGHQIQASGAPAEQSSQDPMMPVPESEDSQPQRRTGHCASQTANQDTLSEQGTYAPGSVNPRGRELEIQKPGVLGDRDQTGPLPDSGAAGRELDRGAPQEGDAHAGAGADPHAGFQEGDIPAPLSVFDPSWAPGRVGKAAEWSCSSPARTWFGTDATEDVITAPLETEQSALGGTRPGGQVDIRLPASSDKQAPCSSCSRAPRACMHLGGETAGGAWEAGLEDQPPSDIPGSSAAFIAVVPRNRESTVDAGDSSFPALEMGPGVSHTQVPGPAPEGPGGLCLPSVWAQPREGQAKGSGSLSHEQDPEGLSLSISGLPEHTDAAGGLPQEAAAHRGSSWTPTELAEQPRQAVGPPEQGAWPESSAMELDFFLDSQLQDALEVPDFEAPLKQYLGLAAGSQGGVEDLPTGHKVGSGWPGPSPNANGRDPVPLAGTQPSGTVARPPSTDTAATLGGSSAAALSARRPPAGPQAPEPPRMEDATETVRGLIMELSNLNRLIMSTHRDLETFKRLKSQLARPLGKPLPSPAQGGQPWRGL
ncbi:break repair meiotic recombinase recruitment factor 1 [Ctenodactylus gundi]